MGATGLGTATSLVSVNDIRLKKEIRLKKVKDQCTENFQRKDKTDPLSITL